MLPAIACDTVFLIADSRQHEAPHVVGIGGSDPKRESSQAWCALASVILVHMRFCHFHKPATFLEGLLRHQ